MEFLLLLFLILSSLSYSTPSSHLFSKEALPTKSGYLPISNTSSFFYTFYEARQPISSTPSKTPLLVWLQGGPGCSSMIGNFFELGPYLLNNNLSLEYNPNSWNRRFGLLFIDNPIGTGFSIAASNEEVPRDQLTVAKHLWIALQSFISLNASFRSRPVYITGESYAGKYVPAIGYYILQQNLHVCRADRIKLRGVAIGNGLTHPVVQVTTHADSGYFSGLINHMQRTYLEELQQNAVRLTLEKKWPDASDARNKVLDSLQNFTGLATLYDIRRNRPYDDDKIKFFLQKQEVIEALGATRSANLWEGCSDIVGSALHEDIMKSMKFAVDGILNDKKRVKVLLYQGMFDIRDGVVSTEAWVKELEWEGMGEFMKANRKVWKVRGEVAGYMQKWGRLSNVVVSGAGHLVPADQGLNSQAMIEDWVQENGLFTH